MSSSFNRPLVSIIMSVKNAAPFLRDCLESIQNQTFKDWELVVVNNFSTDDSLDILKEYELKDERIILLNSDKDDLISALRIAFKESKGELISRMDADDIMKPEKIHWMVDTLQKSGPGTVITNLVEYFAEDEVGDGFKKYETWLNQLIFNELNFTEVYRECVIPSPSWMLYRKDFEIIGSYEPSNYPEDYDLCFRMYKYGLKVKGIPKVLHLWRDHQKRASRIEANYQDQLFHLLKWRYFKEIDLDIQKELILWGGGNKAKKMAKLLLSDQQSFTWVSNNKKKSGHSIYGITHQHFSNIDSWKDKQVMVMVSSENDQEEISDFLISQKLKKSLDFYFFC